VPVEYDTLAAVYDFLVPEALTTPEGGVAPFAPYLEGLEPGARLLDCACGTGPVAVGLALRGFGVVATDASAAMVDRTRALAAAHGASLDARVVRWEALDRQGFAPFDAVLCVGNSITHAAGREGRRAALRAMAAVMRPGAPLVVTSRNWERVRAAGSGLLVDDALRVRGGRRGLVIHAWTIAGDWDDRHALDVAVALIGDGGRVTTYAERLAFWPFRHATLDEDLRAAGLEPERSTYEPEVDRYAVGARRT
jgi:SAM-dependent methyltransferase